MFAARIRRLNVATISGQEARLNCRFCGDYLEDQQKLVNLSCSNDIQDTSRLECRDVFSDRIDKLTVIIKLLKKKYGNYTDCVGGEQSSFVTRVNVNVDSVADTHIPQTLVGAEIQHLELNLTCVDFALVLCFTVIFTID